MSGTVKYLFISEEANGCMQPIKKANLVSGKGIEGDRYFNGRGTFSEKLKGNPAAEVTLIEKEEIDKFNLENNQSHGYDDFRRNVVTEGIRLNDLVGKTFSIGKVTLKGIRLCEPCTHLADTVNQLVLPHLVGRGGLRAQIISSDTIEVGDTIDG